jgi:hypothetical protein
MNRAAQHHRIGDVHDVVADENDRPPAERRAQVLRAEKLVAVVASQEIGERSACPASSLDLPCLPHAIGKSNRRAGTLLG